MTGKSGENQQLVPIVSVTYGRELAPNDLLLINTHRKRDLGSAIDIRPEPTNEDWYKPFFLVREADQLTAFGRLHTVPVEFQGNRHTILGVAGIVAIQRGRGYGKILMSRMKEYIDESGQTAIVFCDPKVTAFYEKCGYSILPNGIQQFNFLDSEHQAIPSQCKDKDVLYIDGDDHLAKQLLLHPDKHLTAFRGLW